MYGSPLKRLIWILLFLGAGGGIATSWVTEPGRVSARKALPEPAEAEVVSGWVTVRSAHPFLSASLSCGGEPLPMENYSDRELETEFTLPRGAVLTLEVSWKSGTPETAVLMSIEPDGAVAQEETFWAKGHFLEEFKIR